MQSIARLRHLYGRVTMTATFSAVVPKVEAAMLSEIL